MDPSEGFETIQARHRKEQRDLVARTTQKKKSATKKTRKGINDECERLEGELKEQQAQELAAFNEGAPEPIFQQEESAEDKLEIVEDLETLQHGGLEKSLDGLSISRPQTNGASDDSTEPSSTPRKKQNRAKARLARRAAEQDALAKQAAAEANSIPNLREQERTKMQAYFKTYGLQEKEIRADGHCLYAAVADQMETSGLSLQPKIQPTIIDNEANGASKLAAYKVTRHAAADFIERNPDEFVGFMEEPLDEYLRKIRDTGEWGGHMELIALAKTYGLKINVLHGDGTVNKIESGEGCDIPDEQQKVIWLGYYRHGFGLGEHYNSLRKVP